MVMPKQPEDSELTAAVLEISKTFRRHTNHLDDWGNWLRSQLGLATKQDLLEMEKRLIDAVAASANIAPSLEKAALKAQSALDRLDATIPDKTG